MKIQHFPEIQKQIQFDYLDDIEIFKSRFFESELGKIYLAIPWDELVTAFSLKTHHTGRPLMFSPQGRIALMFLKNYSGLSDFKLIEQLNGNVEWQFFCGIHLGFHRIDNYKIVSQIRSELASRLSLEKLEDVLFQYWKPFINSTDQIVMDATCYESEVRYPTDVKLLWESVESAYRMMREVCNRERIPILRTKYHKWLIRYIGYSKMRRKTTKKKNALKRSSLLLIDKLSRFLWEHEETLSEKEKERLRLIAKVHTQQYELFHRGITPKGRIVSLHKPYVRPIVRGKEIKPVEFGAKANKIQIDGISFIEHISHDAFNEGVRFKQGVWKAQSLTHVKVNVVGADAIYATNENRRFATHHNIKTDFKAKGPKPSYHKELQGLKKMITKERASRLEGSFGKDKEHYHLRKIKAVGKENEILWIFFGTHTGNALEIGRRISGALKKAA